MDGFLKGYYGYKNLGDEVLFFGVVNWIFANYSIQTLYVEVGDKDWFRNWLNRNRHLLDIDSKKIILVSKDEKINISDMFCFFGGGEVLSYQRKFPYDGWNLVLKFQKHIRKGNFVLLGGISKPKSLSQKLLYKILLPKAKEIIARENNSFDIASKYNENTTLHNDFAQDIFEKLSNDIGNPKKDKLFINMNPYIYNSSSLQTIVDIHKQYKDYTKYFIPFEIGQDTKFYAEIKSFIPDLEVYDWTTRSIEEIFQFMNTGAYGVGARLHFLLFLTWLGIDTTPLYYQEKIYKFFESL